VKKLPVVVVVELLSSSWTLVVVETTPTEVAANAAWRAGGERRGTHG
jgi:hypothetical protein